MIELIHPECEHKAHPCLTDKLRLWRRDGAPAVKIPDGWKGTSVRERARVQVAEAQAAGYDPVPAHDKYRWV